MAAHFEVYTDKAGEHRWRFKASNGQIIAATSEGYTTKQALDRSVEICQQGEGTAEVYQDKAGEFRWRWKATNGAIIATGGEGYVKEADCEHGLESFRHDAPEAEVRVLLDA